MKKYFAIIFGKDFSFEEEDGVALGNSLSVLVCTEDSIISPVNSLLHFCYTHTAERVFQPFPNQEMVLIVLIVMCLICILWEINLKLGLANLNITSAPAFPLQQKKPEAVWTEDVSILSCLKISLKFCCFLSKSKKDFEACLLMIYAPIKDCSLMCHQAKTNVWVFLISIFFTILKGLFCLSVICNKSHCSNILEK